MLNKTLNDDNRLDYRDDVDRIKALVPELSARKIPGSEVQQAFVLNTVERFGIKEDHKIFCIGCYEDTTYEALRILGWDVFGIDPIINMDLHMFVSSTSDQCDIVFSTSVLEHVSDDLRFVRDMITIIKPKGVGILTFDFKKDWHPGDNKPVEDVRLYTEVDIRGRLLPLLRDMGCALIGNSDWSTGSNDFHYGGVWYTFATLVFGKEW